MKGRRKGEGGAKGGAKGEGIKPGHPRPLVLISGLSIERESRNFAGPLAVFDVQASFAPSGSKELAHGLRLNAGHGPVSENLEVALCALTCKIVICLSQCLFQQRRAEIGRK